MQQCRSLRAPLLLTRKVDAIFCRSNATVERVLRLHTGPQNTLLRGGREGLKEVRGQSLSTPFFVVHLLSPSCKQVKFEMVFVAASFTYLLLHPRRHMCLPFEAKE